MHGDALRPCPTTLNCHQVFAAYLRRLGIRYVVYIDHIIFMAHGKAESIRHTRIAVDPLHSVGFRIHPGKISAVPTWSLKFLSLQVITACMEFRVPRSKVHDDLRHLNHSTLLLNEGCCSRSGSLDPSSASSLL